VKSGSKKVVVAALLANAAIATLKFVVAALTLSSAMLAEAVHSVADTGNQILLLIGLKRSQKSPDDTHPFGYGLEQYFWSFVVALMLFFVGAVVSVYEGVEKILEPHAIERAWLVFVILGASIVLETMSFRVAFREFKRHRPAGLGFLAAIRATKDASVAVVLLEDTAALLGLLLAFVGVGLAVITGQMVFDALASIAIGLLLAGVAFLLAAETRELLIGESASRADVARIRKAVAAYPGVTAVGKLLTMHLGPNSILVGINVDFENTLTAAQVEQIIEQLEVKIREAVPGVGKIFIEANPGHSRPAPAPEPRGEPSGVNR